MRKLFRHTRFLPFLLAAVLLTFSCRKEPAHLYGNITSLPNGTVYLKAYEGALRTIDSTLSTAGRFSFTLPEILPNILFVQFEGYPDFFIPVMIGGGDISVSGNFNYHDDIKVSGTAPNDALWKYRESVHDYDVMLRAIDIALADSTSLDSLGRGQLQGKRDSLTRLVARSKQEFVRRNRGSVVSAMFAAGELTDSSTRRQIDSLLGELDPTMADNAFMRKLLRRRDNAPR